MRKMAGLIGMGAIASGIWLASGSSISPSMRAFETARKKAPEPPEPLVRVKNGLMYVGRQDVAHRSYVKQTLEGMAAKAETADDRRFLLAFLSLQELEGNTAAINTWDNQIFTWGTGFSALGGLSCVMNRLKDNEVIKRRLQSVGVVYQGDGKWNVADTKKGQWLAGKPGLRALAASRGMLKTFIAIAREPATRDAVMAAQAACFVNNQKAVLGSLAKVQSQALVNFITHLVHWAPGLMRGVLETASGQNDEQTAREVLAAFVANAKRRGFPLSEKQLRLYWARLRDDGLPVGEYPGVEVAGVLFGRSAEAEAKFDEAEQRWTDLYQWGIKEKLPNLKTQIDHWEAFSKYWKGNPLTRDDSTREVERLIGAITDLNVVETWAAEAGWKRPPRVKNIRPEDLTKESQLKEKIAKAVEAATPKLPGIPLWPLVGLGAVVGISLVRR